MSTATLTKGNISLGLAYSFRGLVHCCHSGKHGHTQTDEVLEKEQRVLQLNQQATGRKSDNGAGLSS